MIECNSLYSYVNNCPHFIDILGLVLHWHHIIPQQVVRHINNVTESRIEAIKKCFEKLKFRIHGKENGVMIEGHIHLKKVHGEDKWNKNIIDELLKVVECCDDDNGDNFRKFFNRWKEKALKYAEREATEDYKKEMSDFCIEPPDFVLLKELEIEAQKTTVLTPNQVSLQSDSIIQDPVVSEAIGTGVQIAVKIITKKIPVVGWGVALYSGYKAYKRTKNIRRTLFAILFW